MALLNRVAVRQDLILVSIVIMTVLMMVLPMPTLMADALIGVDIGIALLLMLMAIYVRSPIEFSTLPSLILLTTAFRLSISITTSRLVLVQGDAGSIIRTFGQFVISGNVIVGLVVYFIITIVQFVVITKGTERVAEVAARFTLDALPGKQSSIDTDVRNGDLAPSDAKRRRKQLERESQLYGAMDGAMKFVKGDAIASLIIIAVNLIGGMAIGCLQRGLSLPRAIQTYSLLAVGDGLIAQVPALLISLTAGLVVTRAVAEDDGDLGTHIMDQVMANSRPLQIGGIVLAALGVVPGFPTLLFVALGSTMIGASFLSSRINRRRTAADFNASVVAAEASPEPASISIRIGIGLEVNDTEVQAGLAA
ncbi:MAG: FHIPEP family type III secretion protein, partial [Janthinobacterium lividum]